ncbi:MAG TPA: hypothetical protein VFV84_04990 [Burkholderiales bacterium]|nr:hypothetical protein [Burkholderiales bacterium]
MSEPQALLLPTVDPSARPEFTDGPSCKAWLEHVPLANVGEAQRQLLLAIWAFNRSTVAAAPRLAALEAAREAVHFVQIEQAKRFTHRAAPLLRPEAEAFENTSDLWEQMRLGYLRCLEPGDPALRAQLALVCQRALAYCGLRMFHHYRAYRQVPARDWRQLHAVYHRAEALGVTDALVKDYLNRDVHDASPRIAYLRAILTGMCNPHELMPRQLTFVAFLLERWAEKVEISAVRPAEDGAPPLAVDLAGSDCANRGPATGPELRYLDARRLAKSIRNRIALLRKGESPARLALGEDCVQPSCEQLLSFLYRQWCEARQVRGAERQRVAAAAQVCAELPAIHYFVTGRPFQAEASHRELTARERDEIATFGRVAHREGVEEARAAARGYACEDWQLADESALGARMVRAAGVAGRRVMHGQLVALRADGARAFQLAQVRWLMTTESGELVCGLRYLPGVPQGVSVRGTGVHVAEERFVPAIALGAVPALQAPPSLVLPSGWFKPKRIVEVAMRTTTRLRLLEAVERGADFERVTYEPLAG